MQNPNYIPTQINIYLAKNPTQKVIKQKLFHHNNLVLFLLYDTIFDFHHIEILRINDSSTSNLFGMFCDLQSATNKFNSIQL